MNKSQLLQEFQEIFYGRKDKSYFHTNGAVKTYKQLKWLESAFKEIESETIEKAKEVQTANIEQAMVYLYRKLPTWITGKRNMSKRRQDSLWGHMCMWIDTYKENPYKDIDELKGDHESF